MSPTVLKIKKYRFFFFSREEKRMHVHVTSPDGEAKFWLEPVVALAEHYGLLSKEIKEYFLPYKDYPWFKKAKVAELNNVKFLFGNHLHWSDLDVDLELKSLKQPEKYPLIYKAKK